MDAAMKLGRQYYVELGQPRRINFIAREGSYHGTTLGALSMSGHKFRREKFLPILSNNIYRVSSCYAYRQRIDHESDAEFVAKKATELENLLIRLGPETVIGFVCEPVVGATLGCVPYVHGYLPAMKAVCTQYGVLFILDEVMCGMGRCGTLHAWQAEHLEEPGSYCRPDIQTIAKGLGGGYQPVAGLLIDQKVVDVLENGTGEFTHGHTYQSHPVACAAALAVQRVIREENLLENCRKQGVYMKRLLHEKLDSHPNVGDIRGVGLFIGIEFVADKVSKEPFNRVLDVATRCQDMALSTKYNLAIYKGNGTVDGVHGDHIILSPALNSTTEFIETIVERIVGAIIDTFDALNRDTHNFV
jgi:adenosylmethionine-8-amino-7-oxononanoate aminotransferase